MGENVYLTADDEDAFFQGVRRTTQGERLHEAAIAQIYAFVTPKRQSFFEHPMAKVRAYSVLHLLAPKSNFWSRPPELYSRLRYSDSYKIRRPAVSSILGRHPVACRNLDESSTLKRVPLKLSGGEYSSASPSDRLNDRAERQQRS